MLLFLNPPSPYARKVLVSAHELGLMEQVELRVVDPWQDPPELLAAAPAGKIPALQLAPGQVLTESTAICMYLADRAGRRLPPDEALDETIRSGRAQALIDAAFSIVIEGRRPEAARWRDWTARQHRALARLLATFPVPPAGRFDLGDIALACGLAYLDFRLPETAWRERQPELRAWFDGISGRPSLASTRPAEGAR